jgi:hypothetical protein
MITKVPHFICFQMDFYQESIPFHLILHFHSTNQTNHNSPLSTSHI